MVYSVSGLSNLTPGKSPNKTNKKMKKTKLETNGSPTNVTMENIEYSVSEMPLKQKKRRVMKKVKNLDQTDSPYLTEEKVEKKVKKRVQADSPPNITEVKKHKLSEDDDDDDGDDEDEPQLKKTRYFANFKPRYGGRYQPHFQKTRYLSNFQHAHGGKYQPYLKRTKPFEDFRKNMIYAERPNMMIKDPKILVKTIRVGNLPPTCEAEELKEFFSKYGKIHYVFKKGADFNSPKPVSTEEAKSFCFSIKFNSFQEVVKALAANGQVFQGRHIRVKSILDDETMDESKAIFIQNLHSDVEEEDLWKLFEPCGPIVSVNIWRLGKKPTAYVNFENADSVSLALKMENVELKGEEMIISISDRASAKKEKIQSANFKKINLLEEQVKKLKEIIQTVNVDKEVKTEQAGVSEEKKKDKLNTSLTQKKKNKKIVTNE